MAEGARRHLKEEEENGDAQCWNKIRVKMVFYDKEGWSLAPMLRIISKNYSKV
jgi:hypothetical protein